MRRQDGLLLEDLMKIE